MRRGLALGDFFTNWQELCIVVKTAETVMQHFVSLLTLVHFSYEVLNNE